MNPRSFCPNGMPDEVVRHIVWLLFYEGMHLVKRGHGFFDDELIGSESGLDGWSSGNGNRATPIGPIVKTPPGREAFTQIC